MDYPDRFKLLLDRLELSPAEFAEEIDIQRSAVSHLLSGRNKPSLSLLQKILGKFTNVNPLFIISGKKPVFIELNGDKPKVDIRLQNDYSLPVEQMERQAPVQKLEKELKQAEKKLKQVILLYTDGSAETYSID